LAYGASILSQTIDNVLQMVTTLFATFCAFGFHAAVYSLLKAEKAGAKKAAPARRKK
jgi:hypothetical protein